MLTGCSESAVMDSWGRASIADAEDAYYWHSGSAPQVYGSVGLLAAAIAQSAEASATANGCPSREENGDTTTYQGDCEADGASWFGKLTVVGATDVEEGGDVSYRFENFGMERTQDCESGGTVQGRSLLAGTMKLEETGETGVSRFDVDLRIEQRTVDSELCTVDGENELAFDYTGTRAEAGNSTTWNGSGRIGEESRGAVNVRTEDEVVDSSVCSSEALSGTTTLEGRDSVAVLTYDGATDCSNDATVTWTLDGEEMGTLEGVSCTVAGGAPSWLALTALLLLRRRRR